MSEEDRNSFDRDSCKEKADSERVSEPMRMPGYFREPEEFSESSLPTPNNTVQFSDATPKEVLVATTRSRFKGAKNEVGIWSPPSPTFLVVGPKFTLTEIG